MSKLNISGSGTIETLEIYVARKLREAILNGDITPGTKLDQNEISKLLNVSRSPVREALRSLASEGLIEMYPHRGAIVVELSPKEIEEIYFIRVILEGTVARIAATRITDNHIDRLVALFEDLETTDDLDEWLNKNRQFHSTIYEVIQRPRLLSLIENLRNTAAPHIRKYIAREDGRKRAQLSHKKMLEACINRDKEQLQFETEKHLQEVCEGAILDLLDNDD